MNANPKELHQFIVRAKTETYVGKGTKTLPYRPEAYELQYSDEDFFYLDSYFGGSDFIGQETVYYKKKPIWAMNYYGRLLDPTAISAAEAGLTIQESLTALYQEGRFLGGFEYQTQYGKYVDTSEGEISSFTGKEWIERNGMKLYELVYHGGLIRE